MSSASTLLPAPTSATTIKITRSVSLNNVLLGQGNERQESTMSPSKSRPNAQRERSIGSSAATANTAAQALLALNAASAGRMTASNRASLSKHASEVTSDGPAPADDKSKVPPHSNRSALPQTQALEDIAIASSTSSTNPSTRIGMGTDTRSSEVQPLAEVSSLNVRKTTRDRQRIVRSSTASTTSASASAAGSSSASTSELVSSLSSSRSSTSLHGRDDGSQNRLAAAADHFVNLDAAEAASADRPHACSKCSCQFTRSSHLVDHMRAKHDGAKPFSCNQVRHSECKLSGLCSVCNFSIAIAWLLEFTSATTGARARASSRVTRGNATLRSVRTSAMSAPIAA
jgi:uncharacterized Zn-finger protein